MDLEKARCTHYRILTNLNQLLILPRLAVEVFITIKGQLSLPIGGGFF